MVEGGFRGIVIAFILVGLFAFALASFGIQLAVDNNANQSLADNQAIGGVVSNFSRQIGAGDTSAEGLERSFINEKVNLYRACGGQNLRSTGCRPEQGA